MGGASGNIIALPSHHIKQDDPITRGIEDFAYCSEQYYMHVDPGNEVLATTTFGGEHCPWIDGVDHAGRLEAASWGGQSLLLFAGSRCTEFDVVPMRTLILRGMLWAARDGGLFL